MNWHSLTTLVLIANLERLTLETVQTYCSRPRPGILLTGATGLLGQYIMRDMLRSGHQLVVVVRASKRDSAWARIERILQRIEIESGVAMPRPVVLEGDIQKQGFGLSSDDRQFVARHCDRMIHNAAILQFHGADPSGEPWTTNVQGTRNALEVCQHSGISHMHYMSTAYVSGCRTGTIAEDELDLGQDFRNVYEKSKFEAEQLVQESNQFETVTIYRPVVVAGDSVTGYTSTYHGLFVYLRLFAMFVPQQQRGPDGRILTPVHIPLDGDEPRNVVPVEWVSQVFCRIFENENAHGKTFHLAPQNRLTARKVIEACYEFFNSHGVEFCGNGHLFESQPDFAVQIMENVAIYSQYETSDPEFDTTNLNLFAKDIPCPEIDSATIQRFLKFGESDLWGKRRPTAILPTDPQTIHESLYEIATDRDFSAPLGVRLLGPGGGDWTISEVPGNDRIRLSRGLGSDLAQLLTIDARQLTKNGLRFTQRNALDSGMGAIAK